MPTLICSCACTGNSALSVDATDTITTPITLTNLKYVDGIQVATIERGGVWDGFSATVGPITCCDRV